MQRTAGLTPAPSPSPSPSPVPASFAAPAPAPARAPAPAPRWAVRVAQLITLVVLPTGLWRLAMVAGFPSGYTAEGFVPFATPNAKLWMMTLSVGCELLALLSLGLVRPWGEVAPCWIPIVGGRPVRSLAAVAPAACGAVALTAVWAAMPLWWTYPHPDLTPAGRLLVGVIYQPLVLWGPLLGALTVSYYRRTRPVPHHPPASPASDRRPPTTER